MFFMMVMSKTLDAHLLTHYWALEIFTPFRKQDAISDTFIMRFKAVVSFDALDGSSGDKIP